MSVSLRFLSISDGSWFQRLIDGSSNEVNGIGFVPTEKRAPCCLGMGNREHALAIRSRLVLRFLLHCLAEVIDLDTFSFPANDGAGR